MNEELQAVFNKNLLFFARIKHSYFKQFIDYTPKRLSLKLSEKGYINLYNMSTGQAVYPEDPSVYAKRQADEFLRKRPHYIVTAEMPGERREGYPFTEYLAKTNAKYKSLVPKIIQGDNNKVEQLFMYGAGLCLQLEHVLNALDVKNLIVFEADTDAIYSSLYIINWEAIFSYFNRPGYSFSIYNVKSTDENSSIIDFILQKKGRHRCAKIDNYFHYDNDELSQLYRNVKYYLNDALGGLGYFEDEKLGLLHTLKNLPLGIPYADKHLSEIRDYNDKPVLIVGNGPSLDVLEDFIRERGGEYIIISCGTALATLLKKGLLPDIHLEQERIKLIEEVLVENTTQEIRNKLFFVGLNPCYTNVFRMFENRYMVMKPNDISTDLMQQSGMNNIKTLEECNPLVSNFGVAFAQMLGFKEIYLAGVDCGMIDNEKHHSKESIHYTEKFDPKEIYQAINTFEVKGNLRNSVLTTSLFKRSKIAIERSIHQFQPQCYNLSDGVYIEGAQPQKSYQLQNKVIIENKTKVILDLFDKVFTKEPILKKPLEKEIVLLKQYFDKLCKDVLTLLSIQKLDYYQMSAQFDEIEQLLKKSQSESPASYRLLNGTVRGVMLNLSAAKKVMANNVFNEFSEFCEPEIKTLFSQMRMQISQDIDFKG